VRSTIVLGRVAGVEIGLNWTWLVVFGLIVWSLATVQFPDALPGRSRQTYVAMGVTATLVFFGCLLLHELGHAIEARREGVRIEGITLWLFGGVARLADGLPSAGAEFRIAAAGPVVSLILGALFVADAAIWPGPGGIRTELVWLGYINLTLVAFNLIPALPLDGGRILRSALWAKDGDFAAATHRAATIGSLLSGAIVALGLIETAKGMTDGIWLVLIGCFILQAGRAERRAAGSAQSRSAPEER
jgi:Zn-dependent protease